MIPPVGYNFSRHTRNRYPTTSRNTVCRGKTRHIGLHHLSWYVLPLSSFLIFLSYRINKLFLLYHINVLNILVCSRGRTLALGHNYLVPYTVVNWWFWVEHCVYQGSPERFRLARLTRIVTVCTRLLLRNMLLHPRQTW